MSRKLLLMTLVASLAVGLWFNGEQPSHAFPQPSAASRAWLFDFTHAAPKPVAVRTAEGEVRWFWYMTYKVVNNSGDERLFIPEITIATDKGDIVPAGRDVPAAAFAAVKDLTGNRLLENPARVVGRLLQGEDNARESVAIWPHFENDVDTVTIFVGGLSGETQVIPNPLTGEDETFRRTLMLEYHFPGTGGRPQDQRVVARPETWVMR